jgi:hypothetical protein
MVALDKPSEIGFQNVVHGYRGHGTGRFCSAGAHFAEFGGTISVERFVNSPDTGERLGKISADFFILFSSVVIVVR